jgi:mRNA interferase RelE/StbE
MNVEFLSKFSKDIDSISVKAVKLSLAKLIEQLELLESLQDIANIKKLKGHKSAYRIRMGDYRVGFFLEKNTILLARIAHRKDIYNIFP